MNTPISTRQLAYFNELPTTAEFSQSGYHWRKTGVRNAEIISLPAESTGFKGRFAPSDIVQVARYSRLAPDYFGEAA